MGFIIGPWLAQAVRAAVDLSAPVIREAVEVIDVDGAGTVVDVGGAHGSFALLIRAGLRRTAATPVEPPYVVIEATPAG